MHLSKTTTLSSMVSILYDRNLNPSPILILDDVIAFHDKIRFRDPIMNVLILLTLIISLTNANSCA